jgi:hypothetical protein
MEGKATPRQVAYIERLSSGNGLNIERPLNELTMSEASELIQQIAVGAKSERNGPGGEGSKNNGSKRGDFNQGARLGMAFKCCYRRWTGNGHNILKRKDDFIQNVLDTYVLINEIAEKASEVAS